MITVDENMMQEKSFYARRSWNHPRKKVLLIIEQNELCLQWELCECFEIMDLFAVLYRSITPPFQIRGNMADDQNWFSGAIFYHVYVRAFVTATRWSRGYPGTDFSLAANSRAGVNTIWLMPIFEQSLKDEDQGVVDYYKVRTSTVQCAISNYWCRTFIRAACG